jgi:RNA polymerase sigma factor (sigma-70 family)
MDDRDWLARQFEAHRSRLRAVAYRMLGSSTDADDAVQETWLRLSRTDVDAVDNLAGWLTTVVGRICLDMLRSRAARPEDSTGASLPDPVVTYGPEPDPETEVLLADSVGLALLVVLDTLTPAERLGFVLHDMFGVPFEEIARTLGRSTDAAKMLASRARRRVRGAAPADGEHADPARQREVVEAFLAAARGGDFAGLLALLDPDVVLRADAAAVELGAPPEARGADAVGGFVRVARGAKAAVLDGTPVAVWLPGGEPRVVLLFRAAGDKITEIDVIADPARLSRLDFQEP